MVWMYIVALLVPPFTYCLYMVGKVIKWFFYIRKIKAIVNRFCVEPYPHWLYGHLNIIKGPDEASMMTYLKWTEQADKGAFPFDLGLSSQLCCCHPDTVKAILKTTEPKGFIPATGTGYKLLIPWLGQGLLTSRGERWFRSRRLLTPAFHFDILKPYIKIYNSCAENLMTNFEENCQNGKSVDIVPFVSLCTLNVMRKCAFSSADDIQIKGTDNKYVNAILSISISIMSRVYMNPLFFIDRIYALTANGKKFFKLLDVSHKEAEGVIAARKKDLESEDNHKQTNRYVDFLDILLLAKDENGIGLTDREIRDEVETFMFEGHDTTASGIFWFLYNIARHREIQRKMQEEIDLVLKDRTEVLWEDLNNIPYTTQCMKESLRMHPPVPTVNRELTKPLKIAEETLLPGTIVEINPYQVHHNPRVWGADHMTFDPERFHSDKLAHMDSHAFIPFSAGPRNCIGQNFAMNEIKTTIMRVLHEYTISVDDTHKVEMYPILILRAKNGIKLHFEKRN